MRVLTGALILLLGLAIAPSQADEQAPRLALVIGNAHYKLGQLATPVNDAGLVAETLKEAGFDVTEGADLNQDALRRALQDFVGEVQQAGPHAVVFVYLAGRGLQFAGENYFTPVDAVVAREADVPVANVRLVDYTRMIAAAPARARIFVFDIARYPHFATEGHPFASGLALVAPEPGCLYAFNAAPSTIAPDEPGPYGAYAEALAEMMREGMPVDQMFADTRLRVNQATGGAVVPWDLSKIEAPIFFFVRDENAPPLGNFVSEERQKLNGLPVADAYTLAVERDTLAGYEEFLVAYPRDPLSLRVRALLAARREALTWARAVAANTPEAYWTYMRRYRFGPHFADARRRLAALAAPLDPPPRFQPYDFEGLPAPSEGEYLIVDQPVLIFNDPAFPPPPAPNLPLRPVEFEHLQPPQPGAPGALPVPAPIALQYAKPAAKPGAIVGPAASQNAPAAAQDTAGSDQSSAEAPKEEPAKSSDGSAAEEGKAKTGKTKAGGEDLSRHGKAKPAKSSKGKFSKAKSSKAKSSKGKSSQKAGKPRPVKKPKPKRLHHRAQ